MEKIIRHMQNKNAAYSIIIAVLTLFLSSGVLAGSNSGRVVDEQNNLISNMYIRLEPAIQTTMTDAEGVFYFETSNKDSTALFLNI